jgi:hypothetical protein
MPLHIRQYYIHLLIKTKEEEKKQMDKANKKPSSTPYRKR